MYWEGYDFDKNGLYTPEVMELTDLRTFDETMIFIAQHIQKNTVCFETGTTYCFRSHLPYWNTTSSIAKRILEPNGGMLWSFDLINRREVLKELFALGNLNLNNVIHIVGNSVDKIKRMMNEGITLPIDLVCLDSGEDEDLLVDEYNALKDHLNEKHYILVDDIHNKNSVKYKKIVPLLKELGYDWVQIPTETGLFVAAKGYPIPRRI